MLQKYIRFMIKSQIVDKERNDKASVPTDNYSEV